MSFAALLLTGGRGSRMGGVDKPALPVGDRPMAVRVAAAVAGASRLVVVGPAHPDVPADAVARESPPGAGPVAAIAAGLAHTGNAARVVVLAADLPFITAADVGDLLAAIGNAPAAVLVDGAGRDQYLAAAWQAAALRAALEAVGDPAGVAVRRLVAAAGAVARVRPAADRPPPWFDCDTQADLARAEEYEREHTGGLD